MSSTKEKKRDARKKRSAAAARGDEDAKKKMKNDADRKKEHRRIRAERAKPDWPGFPDRDASLGPALTDKEKAAQQAARDSIAKEKARKKKRVRTNEHSERHKERLRALISEALLEVQREFIKILEKQDMCRVDGVLASEPERRLELSRDPDLAFGCYLPEDSALPQIGAGLAWLHTLEIVFQTNLTPWSCDCDGGPRRKRRVFDFAAAAGVFAAAAASDASFVAGDFFARGCRSRVGSGAGPRGAPLQSFPRPFYSCLSPDVLYLPSPWGDRRSALAGYKLDATRELAVYGLQEIMHSRAPRCPEDQADARTWELLCAFREKALYLCDGRRAVSWRCHKCGWLRDIDQINEMDAKTCPHESCDQEQDDDENEFLPETPRPRAYIDVSIDDKPTGRIVCELFDDKVPKMVEWFLELCKGVRGKTYKGGDVWSGTQKRFEFHLRKGGAPGQKIRFEHPYGEEDQYVISGEEVSPKFLYHDVYAYDDVIEFGCTQCKYPTDEAQFRCPADEAKFTIYEPFLRKGTLYFRDPGGTGGLYILMGTRPLGAHDYRRDVPFGRVLQYQEMQHPDPPNDMWPSWKTMNKIVDAVEAKVDWEAPWNATKPNVKIFACGRLEDADNSISRMAYLAALPPRVCSKAIDKLRGQVQQCACGPIEQPAYKFLEPYGDDWERALAAVAGRSEACAARVAELSPDDYSGLLHALDTELESELRLEEEREAAQRLEDADHSDVEDDDVVEGPCVEQGDDDYVEQDYDEYIARFNPDAYIDYI